MFIVWGNKLKRKRLGYAAEFCRLCRVPTVHECVEIRTVGHLYFISMGKGTVVGMDGVCGRCAMSFNLAPARFAEFAPTHLDSIERLAAISTPGLLRSIEPLIELEERILKGEASPAERLERAIDTFCASEYHVMRWLGKGTESVSAVMGLLLIVSMVGAAIAFGTPGAMAWAIGWAILAVAMLVTLIWRSHAMPRRVAARKALGSIARSLMAVDPSVEELDAALSVIKRAKRPSARWFSGRQVRAAVDQSLLSYAEEPAGGGLPTARV